MRASTPVALGLIAASRVGAACAQTPATLDKIKSSGSMTLAYRESSIPFSYLGGDGQPTGFGWEICGKIVEQVKKATGRADLKVATQSVTSQNRIPLVANGTVDLECGSTVNNIERQAQVGFSVTSFVVATRFIGFKSANLKTLEDLRGKTVAVTTGTNTVKRVRELDAAHKLGLNLIYGKDHAESMLLVSTGRAAAFFEDDILLTGLAAASANAADYALSTEGYSADPYALMFAKGDAGMKRVVDDTLTGLFKSGEIVKLYDKWFTKPIPPKSVNLNFPMGAAMKRIVANPTDAPDPRAYQ